MKPIPIITCAEVDTFGRAGVKEIKLLDKKLADCLGDPDAAMICEIYQELMIYWMEWIEIAASYYRNNCKDS
jgi:hypothetical protein